MNQQLLPELPGGLSSWSLEAPVGDFTDRHGYVADVKRVAEGGGSGPKVVVIHGRSGLGKSALLLKCAAELRELFDKSVLIDFRPLRHKGGVSVSDALAGALPAFGVAQHWIPADLPGRQSLYRSTLEGQRVLVLLDNVSDVAHIAAFLPNSSRALVLVTSDFAIDEVYELGYPHLLLKRLDDDYGVELLAKICAQDRELGEAEPVRRLVDLCAGSPFDLRVIGGQLRMRPELSVAELLADLEADLARMPDGASKRTLRMTERFNPAYDRLSASQAHLYRVLGILPGLWQPPGILSAALDLPERVVRAGLGELVFANLAEKSGDGYLLPGTLHSHARWAANSGEDPDEIPRILERAVRAWLADAVEADRAAGRNRWRVEKLPAEAAPPNLTKQAALAWFASQHDNLLAVLRLAAEQHLYGVVWRLFEAMWPFYSSSVLYEAWQEAGELAVVAAAKCEDSRAEARVRCLLSRAFVDRRRFAEADAHLLAARELAAGDRLLFASVLDFAGQSLFKQGGEQVVAALAAFREAVAINEEFEDERGIALQSQFVGRCLGALGDVEGALAAFDRADGLIVRFEDLRTQSRIALSRGKVLYIVGGRDAEAVAALHDAIDFADRMSQHGTTGLTALVDEPLKLLIEIARRQGDAGAERTYLQRRHQLHTATGSPEADELRSRLAALPE
ncbi:NB-ARC domain-containing protein [Amycolatopsis sp. H20-H5]|uniref:NB-ARC domain-containing protein n=1 Tax=Amycolatopsis sp. H20-H5 TaxID=3046309 RepID=UPI002DBF0190|nr:NB-ARC domain-containing protein [Amycolatopsis sp. H20-H5]MEC3978949.1 NB-ARC domain-containing protein [Amycolatopsis sp. H20-H5]